MNVMRYHAWQYEGVVHAELYATSPYWTIGFGLDYRRFVWIGLGSAGWDWFGLD